MAFHLEDDSRLLDLLQASTTPEPVLTLAAVKNRLSDLCAAQGLKTEPEQLERTAALFLRQRQTDAELVQLIQRLPQAEQDQADAERLQARLKQVCGARQIDVTPVQISRGVAVAQALKQPFRLWKRPQTEQERRQALNAWDRYDGLPSVLFGSMLALGMVLSLVGMIGAACTVDTLRTGWFHGFRALMLAAFPVGLILGGFLAEGVHPRNRRVPHRWRFWFRGDSMMEMVKLKPAEPNVERMERWEAHPQAAQALKWLAQTPVLLMEVDAEHLDALIEATEQEAAAAKAIADRQAWNQRLAQKGLPV